MELAVEMRNSLTWLYIVSRSLKFAIAVKKFRII